MKTLSTRGKRRERQLKEGAGGSQSSNHTSMKQRGPRLDLGPRRKRSHFQALAFYSKITFSLVLSLDCGENPSELWGK